MHLALHRTVPAPAAELSAPPTTTLGTAAPAAVRAVGASAGASRRSGPLRRGRVPSVVVTLGVVSLLTDLSSEAVAAVLPLYLTTALGLSTIAYGVVDGLMQGASALVRVAGGWAADRGDHPKRVALLGYGLSMLTRAALVVATGFGAVTALVTVDRIGKGIRTAPRDAMIAASSDPRSLGRSFGVHRTLDTVGAATGPLLAFAILWLIPDGYRTVFVVALGSAVLGVAVLALLVPDLRPRRAAWLDQHRTREGRGLPRCKGCSCTIPGLAPTGRPFSLRDLSSPVLRRLLLAAGALGLLTVGDGFVYLALQSREQLATAWFPLLFVGTNLSFMVLATPVGRLADRVGRARVFVAGHGALVLAYVCAGSPVGFTGSTFVVLLLLGAFAAATDGVLAAAVGRVADASVRGTAIGTAQTVVALARMLASAAFGVLWFTVGRSAAMLAVAAALALAVPACAYLVRHLDEPPENRPDTAASPTSSTVAAPPSVDTSTATTGLGS